MPYKLKPYMFGNQSAYSRQYRHILFMECLYLAGPKDLLEKIRMFESKHSIRIWKRIHGGARTFRARFGLPFYCAERSRISPREFFCCAVTFEFGCILIQKSGIISRFYALYFKLQKFKVVVIILRREGTSLKKKFLQ